MSIKYFKFLNVKYWKFHILRLTIELSLTYPSLDFTFILLLISDFYHIILLAQENIRHAVRYWVESIRICVTYFPAASKWGWDPRVGSAERGGAGLCCARRGSGQAAWAGAEGRERPPAPVSPEGPETRVPWECAETVDTPAQGGQEPPKGHRRALGRWEEKVLRFYRKTGVPSSGSFPMTSCPLGLLLDERGNFAFEIPCPVTVLQKLASLTSYIARCVSFSHLFPRWPVHSSSSISCMFNICDYRIFLPNSI